MLKFFTSCIIVFGISFAPVVLLADAQVDWNWFANDLAKMGIIKDYSVSPEKYALSEQITKKEALQISVNIIAKSVPKSYICKWYLKHPKMIKGQISQLCGVIERSIDLGIFGRSINLSHLEEKIDIRKAVVMFAKAANFSLPLSMYYPYGSVSKMTDADILFSLQNIRMFPDIFWWEYGGIHLYEDPSFQGFLQRWDAYRLIGTLLAGVGVRIDEYVTPYNYSEVAFLFPNAGWDLVSVPESSSSGQILFSTRGRVYVTFGRNFENERFPAEAALNNLYEADITTNKVTQIFHERTTYAFVGWKIWYTSPTALISYDLQESKKEYILPRELQNKIISSITVSEDNKKISFIVLMWAIASVPSRLYSLDTETGKYTLEKTFEPYFPA